MHHGLSVHFLCNLSEAPLAQKTSSNFFPERELLSRVVIGSAGKPKVQGKPPPSLSPAPLFFTCSRHVLLHLLDVLPPHVARDQVHSPSFTLALTIKPGVELGTARSPARFVGALGTHTNAVPIV